MVWQRNEQNGKASTPRRASTTTPRTAGLPQMAQVATSVGGRAVPMAALTDRGDTATALLAFIVAMGVVGGVTAKPTILALQAAPAALALALLHLA